MEQGIASWGNDCIIVQVKGDGNSVTVDLPRLALLARHRRRGAPEKPLDVLNAFTCELPLQGRRTELDALRSWLAETRPIALRCVIRGGRQRQIAPGAGIMRLRRGRRLGRRFHHP